jgi:protocatechuate 3,4-dioxygenase beta subunit
MSLPISVVPLLMFFSLTPAFSQEEAPFPPAPEDVGSTVNLAPGQEPGERLIITGTVYQSDGRTPMRDFMLYLYQTDASGVYNRTDGSWRRPRLHGWVRTDSKGKYEIRTIKPGNYPDGTEPAHIHAVIQLPGEPATWIDNFLFEDDAYLSEREKKMPERDGFFSSVMKMRRGSNGVIHCVRDIRVDEPK